MSSLHIEHRENFVTEVVARFDGDFACSGSCERLSGGSVEGGPGRLINLGPQCPQIFIGVGLRGPFAARRDAASCRV